MTASRTLFAAASTALLALIAAVALAAGLSPGAPPELAGPVTTVAQPGAGCEDDDRNCNVWDEDPPEPPPGLPPGNTGGGSGGGCFFNNGDGTIRVSDDRGRPAMVLVAAQTGMVQVPCYMDGWGWYSGGCYYGDFPDVMDIPPPPEGKTEEDGRWYFERCLLSVSGVMPNQSFTTFAVLSWAWFDSDEVPTVTPEDVALNWLATIALDGVEFQLSPPPPGAGLVGLPVWLGVAETANTWGPISDTHCIGAVCVEISAAVSEVAWNMGDGTVVTCTADQHVAWRSGMDFRNPGNRCHHHYHRASRGLPNRQYPITATSTWTVVWSAGGASGTLSTERTSETALRIDEIQVLTSQ